MEDYLSIDPREIGTAKLHGLMQGAIAPRPIAFASTVDRNGKVNLSPFSFFNMFSTNPPILVFSPSRRVRNNTTKHTLENVKEVPEVVINLVSYSIVEQASLASCEYPVEVNEFRKAGLTELASKHVKPPRVAESPVSFECKVNQIIALGTEGGAGNLVVCEVMMAHFKKGIFDEQGIIDPQKLDVVARMGADYYCRAHGENIFIVPKPNTKLGIGVDQLPQKIRNSSILTGNDLGKLANSEKLPEGVFTDDTVAHLHAKKLLAENKIEEAWRLLLSPNF
ncbi:MAG: Nitrilotriacetate monooxygenase component B [Cytophagales bacterium]|jgi:flavin reductase (DIM6/NTAB) family NADH-FMN oxidoreductase RutF|nr:flavin reductase family protein [Bacteroidota bacterium]MBS1981323.1 flavin reductase family protein [Bacteroidota bacterium]WHZ09342.1 MAG: Nitrilotriacetate monooxygenase component B [Cytophagales bacterium]